jgi:hypothetical protein
MSRTGAVRHRGGSVMTATDGRKPIVPDPDPAAACADAHCLGNYDFDDIARFARQRFVDGIQTMELLERASSRRELEEIALVSMLDVHDDVVRDLRLDCRHARTCKTTNCRARLKTLIEQELAR